MKKLIFSLTAVSTAITFFLFLPYSSNISSALPNSVDPLFYAWNLSHNVRSATQRFKDLLDTNIFYPETNTLAFSDTLFAQTLFTAPIIVLTENPVLAENLYILSTFPMAALAMFFLSYYLTGHAWASALSGLFYAFSYPRLSQIGHLPAISSQWLPLFFLYLIKYLRKEKLVNLAVSFFWYVLSITSTVYFGIFLIPLAAVVFMLEVIGRPFTRIGRIMRNFFILGIPAIVILVIVLFPYIRLRAEYPGIKRSLEDSAKLSAVPIDYISVLPTSWLGDIGFPVNTNERSLYPTITLLSLALFSFVIAMKSQRKTVLIFGLIAAGAFVLSFGPFISPEANTASPSNRLPYYYLYKIFPLLQSVRVPARWSIFVILGLSALASITLSRLMKQPERKYIGVLIALVFLAEVWQTQTPFVSVPLGNNLPPVYRFIESAPDDSIIVEVPFHPEWTGRPMEDQLRLSYNEISENDVFAMEAYRTYFSSYHRKRMLNGYSGYFPNIYHDHASIFDKFPTPHAIEILRQLRIRYILVHADQYTSQPFLDVERFIRKYPMLKKVQQFGDDHVYELDSTQL